MFALHRMGLSKLSIVLVYALPFVVFGISLSAQNNTNNFTLISPTGFTTVYIIEDRNQEMLVLSDLAQLFQLDIREDSRGETLTVTYRGKSILLTEDQKLVSVTGSPLYVPFFNTLPISKTDFKVILFSLSK